MEIIFVEMIKEMNVEVSMAAKEVVSADLTLINNALDDFAGEELPGQALEKIAELEAIKASANQALKDKGVNPVTALRNLPVSIKTIGDSYQRPSFWPALPEIPIDESGEPTEEVIYMTVACFPNTINRFYCYKLTGNTVFDWGDGNIINYGQGIGEIDHIFDFDNIPGGINEKGYKCAIVAIRPQTGQHLTYYYGPTNATNRNRVLEVVAAIPNMTAFEPTRNSNLLKSFKVIGTTPASLSVVTNSSSFNGATNLRNIELGVLTNPNKIYLFFAATALPETIPDLSNATSLVLSFYYSGLLQSERNVYVTMPKQNCDCSRMFDGSYVKGIFLDDCSFVTNLSLGFRNCFNLVELKVPNIKVTFSVENCANLRYDEIKRIIENDLGTPATTATLTITSTPDAAEIMGAISAGDIIVPAGWTIAN